MFYNSCYLLCTYHVVSEKRARCLSTLSYMVHESLWLQSGCFFYLFMPHITISSISNVLIKVWSKLVKLIIHIIYMIYIHISVLMPLLLDFTAPKILYFFSSNPCSSFKSSLACHFLHQASSNYSPMNSSFESDTFHCSSYLLPMKGTAQFLVTTYPNPCQRPLDQRQAGRGWVGGHNWLKLREYTGWPMDNLFRSFCLCLSLLSLCQSLFFLSQLNYELKKQSIYKGCFG